MQIAPVNNMGGSPGDVSEEPVTREAKEGLENEL